MKIKWLPIIPLFLFGAAHAQQLPATFSPLASASSAGMMDEVKEVPFSMRRRVLDGLGVTGVSFFYNLGGGFAMPFANYNGVGTAGTGRRLFIDLGVKIPVGNSNFSARNSFMSVSIGINAIKLKDNYKKEGPTGSADNEYYLTAVTLPISYTSSNFIFGDEAGLY